MHLGVGFEVLTPNQRSCCWPSHVLLSTRLFNLALFLSNKLIKLLCFDSGHLQSFSFNSLSLLLSFLFFENMVII